MLSFSKALENIYNITTHRNHKNDKSEVSNYDAAWYLIFGGVVLGFCYCFYSDRQAITERYRRERFEWEQRQSLLSDAEAGVPSRSRARSTFD